jgi:hypothetical protein
MYVEKEKMEEEEKNYENEKGGWEKVEDGGREDNEEKEKAE